MIARIENYSATTDLGLWGCEEEGILDYEALGEPHCLSPSGKIYLDATLHHAQAFVDEGVYPVVVIFLPKRTLKSLETRFGNRVVIVEKGAKRQNRLT